jgi:GMP synthase-like glutamine amidotransferase
MYLYVVVQDPGAYYREPKGAAVKARLERASRERCLIVPYHEFNPRVVRDLKPRAIALSGFGGPFQALDARLFRGMNDVFHQCDLPMIAFCGSHQLMGFAFNRDLHRVRRLRDEPMRRLGAREHWPRVARGGDPRSVLGRYFVAQGFFPIRRLASDPLFAGLPRTMIMRCSHYCEVKRLPRDFVLLAGSDHCRIEAMRHRARPLYGTQFHPEQYEAPFFHGRALLENFAAIVRRFWAERRSRSIIAS